MTPVTGQTNLLDQQVRNLVELFRRREASPVEAINAAFSHIDYHNPKLNAFRGVDRDAALAAARASEERWMRGAPLGLVDGVPATLKDTGALKGWSTRIGSRTTDEHAISEVDSPCAARLKEHGAIFLGKTTTPEFGWKAVTDSPLTGVTRNPWNASKTSGGSSGGAAVAAATRMGLLHIGGDGGGSIRIPAALSGVYGMKATLGRVPRLANAPFVPVAHDGPLTACVSDAALMMTIIARPDARDPSPAPADYTDYRVGLEDGVAGLRIAFSPTLGYVKLEEDVEAACRNAAAAFDTLGANVEEVTHIFDNPSECWRIVKLGLQSQKIVGKSEAAIATMDPALVECAYEGQKLTINDIARATRMQENLARQTAALFDRFDLLITPSLPVTAFDVNYNNPPHLDQYRDYIDSYSRFNEFLYPFNMTSNPAANMPCGLSTTGLPIGLQIVGSSFSEHTVLKASRALESVMPIQLPRDA